VKVVQRHRGSRNFWPCMGGQAARYGREWGLPKKVEGLSLLGGQAAG